MLLAPRRHAPPGYWAIRLLEADGPVYGASAPLAHVNLRTFAPYAAPRPDPVDEIARVLERRHEAVQRGGRTA